MKTVISPVTTALDMPFFGRAMTVLRLDRWEPFLRALGVVIVLVMTIVPLSKIVHRPRGDFSNHVRFGGRLLASTPIYEGGLDIPYPPAWAMAHAPFSLLPLSTAQPLAYIIGPLALVVLLFCVASISRAGQFVGRKVHLWMAMLSVIFCSGYISRDFVETGPNLFLVSTVWLACLLWSKGRDHWGGGLLGLAIALKCTAGIFLLYFLWKRQFRFAAATCVSAAAFSLAPALVAGPSSYTRDITTWTGNLIASLRLGDPSMGILGQEEVTNKSLRPVLARYLMTLPEGHRARVDHPAVIDFLSLPPRTANRAIQIVTMALVLAVAWGLRGKIGDRRDPSLAFDLAAVGVLGLLLSPITWGHHCVALIPSMFVVLQSVVAGKSISRGLAVLIAIYLAVGILLPLNRAIFGLTVSRVVESYHPTTWSFLLLLVIVLRLRQEWRTVVHPQVRSFEHGDIRLAA